MTFQFNPPQASAPAPTPAPTSAPSAASPFAPPVATAATAAQALAGFGEGAIDARHPFLPVGFAGELELLSTYGKDGRNTGFSLYIEARCTRIAAAGGGEGAARQAAEAKLKNANVAPAQVGNVYTMRISGFSREDSRAFAISDTKLFLCAILEEDGLRPDVAVSPQQWDALAAAMAAGKLNKQGRKFLANATTVTSKAGLGKLKVTFYPPSASAAPSAG